MELVGTSLIAFHIQTSKWLPIKLESDKNTPGSRKIFFFPRGIFGHNFRTKFSCRSRTNFCYRIKNRDRQKIYGNFIKNLFWTVFNKAPVFWGMKLVWWIFAWQVSFRSVSKFSGQLEKVYGHQAVSMSYMVIIAVKYTRHEVKNFQSNVEPLYKTDVSARYFKFLS